MKGSGRGSAGYSKRRRRRRLERIQELREVGKDLGQELERWVEKLPARIQDRLAAIGLLDCRSLAASRPLKDIVAQFRESLLAGGVTTKHADWSSAMALRVFEGCGFQSWSNVEPLAVERFLQSLRTGKEGIGAATSNHVLAAAKHFCRWMVASGLAAESPLRGLKPLNPRVDRRYKRRALSAPELRALIATTATCPERFGMSGPERALLYRLAVESGLRAGELTSLRVESFDLSSGRPTVKVEAANSKHRREDILPLRQELALELNRFLSGMPPPTQAFQLTRRTRTAQMLRADLGAAGIRAVTFPRKSGHPRWRGMRQDVRNAEQKTSQFHSRAEVRCGRAGA